MENVNCEDMRNELLGLLRARPVQPRLNKTFWKLENACDTLVE